MALLLVWWANPRPENREELELSESESSVNKQVKSALSAVRDLLSGRADDTQAARAQDEETRRAVAEELLAVMSRVGDSELSGQEHDAEQLTQEKERARQLFMELGHFEEAVEDLRAASTTGKRAAAARALGLVGSQRATVHLVAAMFDDDAEVRDAAGEALNQVGDPSVSGLNPAEVAGDTTPVGQAGFSLDTLLQPEDFQDAEELKSVDVREMASDEQGHSVPAIDMATAPDEELLLKEHSARESIDAYQRQLTAAAISRQKAENEARWRAEREAKIAKEAESRRVEEEQQQHRAQQEASRRRSNETEMLSAESSARQKAEAEVHRIIEEESGLRLEIGNLRQAVDDLSRQRAQLEESRRVEAEAARLAAATQARQEAEKRHQEEMQRLHEEEQALRSATEETAVRRAELETSRHNTETEVAALKDERSKLLATAESEIKQFKEELAQLLAAETSRRAEAERQRREAEERKQTEEDQLRSQMEALRKATSEVSARRAEVEASRVKAEKDAERLTESLERMRAAEQKRALAEHERSQVESATNERVATEERLLDEARRRAIAEQERIDEEKRRHDEAEKNRMASLEEVYRQTELEAKQRADKEKHLLGEIDHLRIEDAEARRRIEEAETVKRTSEAAYRVIAEKLQRTEAEAHAATQQESQTLQKLESVRRELAEQAQARAAQEKRVRNEIEQLQRQQDEERPRLEAAILQRTAAAARLQQMKDTKPVPPTETQRYQVAGSSTSRPFTGEGSEGRFEGRSAESTPRDEGLRLVPNKQVVDDDLPTAGDVAATSGPPAVGTYLKSVDPYKRAAAVTELARSEGSAAFSEVVRSFDDPSPQVRNAAARALSNLEPLHTVDFFNRALEEATDERRRSIGSAISGSGMAAEAIEKLASESREHTYNALSILFVMAKTGEVQPLVRAIEEHPKDEVRSAVVKLLTLSGHGELATAAMRRREGN